MSTASAKFKKSISLLLIINLSVWIVAGSKLENPDWNMWIDKDDGQLNNKRITAKSVFIAPPITKCSEGYRIDHHGHCVKITTVNHANQWQFYLDKLNLMFAKKPESNAVVAGSEPFKLNIPLFSNIPVQDENKRNSTRKPDTNNSQKPEITTRKQPHFTDLFNLQSTFITNGGKTDFPSTTTNIPSTESTKSEAWSQTTKTLPESTTLNDKFETIMWITEKPKREKDSIGNNPAVYEDKSGTNTSYLTSTVELNKLTTEITRENSTQLFTTQTPLLSDKTGTTAESLSTIDANVETVYPSSQPPATLLDNTRTTFIPTSHSEQYSTETAEPYKRSTTQANYKQEVMTSTTDAPFLIIVTDTNNHIVNTNDSEPSVETDYILISNSSSSLTNVQKDEAVEQVSHKKKGEVKIVDKICIDSELCNDEIILPYFESTKTIRNNNPKVVLNSLNHTKTEGHPEPSENVRKPIENSKIMNVLQNIKYEETGPSQQTSDTNAGSEAPKQSVEVNTSSPLDSSHVYESLKMPPSSPSKLNIKSDINKKSEPTVQTLVNIVQPTSAYYSSTPVYNPSKKSAPPTTQRSPTLTTTKRIFTHPSQKPYTDDSNVYNLMYSVPPANVDYNSNSNEYLYGSGSSHMEPQYGSYDTSSYVRFPSDQPQPFSVKQHPNSKFSLDFQNSFGADASSAGHAVSSGNNFKFPSISRTPASTFNSNRWSNTRWPPQQPEAQQYDGSWNSRWPPHQQQLQQQYYNQNGRFQQNVPLTNYKLLQL